MKESQTIRIQYLDDSIQRLTYVGGKSDWIDLAAVDEDSERDDGDTEDYGFWNT